MAASARGPRLHGGLLALAGVKLNFLNFMALPITLGVGVDYAVNLLLLPAFLLLARRRRPLVRAAMLDGAS